MSEPEKDVTFGATIERPSAPDLSSSPAAARQHLSTIIERDSKASSAMLSPTFDLSLSRPSTPGTPSPASPTSPVSPQQEHYDPANPFSAFYQHPSARRSAEHAVRPSLQLPKPAHYDAEKAGLAPVSQVSSVSYGGSSSSGGGKKTSVEVTKECSMWPSRETLRARRKQRRGCWGRLSKRNRVLLQLLIAFLVVGAAVGIGVGVSRAVGGGVWAGQGQTKQLNAGQ